MHHVFTKEITQTKGRSACCCSAKAMVEVGACFILHEYIASMNVCVQECNHSQSHRHNRNDVQELPICQAEVDSNGWDVEDRNEHQPITKSVEEEGILH